MAHVLNLLASQDRLSRLTLPKMPFHSGKAILLHTLRLHLYTISRLHWSLIVPVFDDSRIEKMLMEMVDVLQNGQPAGDADIIDCT